MTCRLCYYIYVAYDGNELNTVCGSGGTADALASGASGGDPVEVQILSTAPFLFMNFIPKTRSWWNGRHATLRGWWEKSRVGSNPTDRTNIELMRTYVTHESFFVFLFCDILRMQLQYAEVSFFRFA